MGTQCIDTVTPAGPNAHPSGSARQVNAILRAEALRQLRWQRREWLSILEAHALDTPCLVPPAERVGLNSALDLLREAGEEVPPALYRRGSLVRTTDAAGGTVVGISLARLVVEITQALEWFDLESAAPISAEHQRPAAFDRRA